MRHCFFIIICINPVIVLQKETAGANVLSKRIAKVTLLPEIAVSEMVLQRKSDSTIVHFIDEAAKLKSQVYVKGMFH